MATYKIIGKRFLRKYTAAELTSSYMAASDAQKVVYSLCDVPWEAVATRQAETPPHGDEKNAANRDKFDAALFCGEHDEDAKTHRAYANAAVYRYVIPSAAQGKTLASLAATVTSDPYNSKGCRLHVFTNSTGVIPTSCHDVRGEDSSGAVVEDGTTASAVAPRETKNATVNGKTAAYWYPCTATATLTPTSGLVLQKYLYLAVVLESYSTTRGNWLEGSSYIENSVQIETAEAVSGWTSGLTYNLAEETSRTFAVAQGGIVPSVPANALTGERSVVVRADADLVADADGLQAPIRSATDANAAAAVSRLYAAFYAATDTPPAASAPTAQDGVVFNVTRTFERHAAAGSDAPVDTDVLRINSRVLVVPFAFPRGFRGSLVRVSYEQPAWTDGTTVRVYLCDEYLTSLAEGTLKDPGVYDGISPSLTLLGEINASATQTDFALPRSVGRVGSLVFAGFFEPEEVNLSSCAEQGTGDEPFMPDVAIVE